MVTRRGTTNRNVRGNSEDRRRRREYLVATYAADMVYFEHPEKEDRVVVMDRTPQAKQLEEWGWTKYHLCRCYRCGKLLDVNSVSPDKIKPQALGGTYRRENIRPACDGCQSLTGGILGAQRRELRKAAKDVNVVSVTTTEGDTA